MDLFLDKTRPPWSGSAPHLLTDATAGVVGTMTTSSDLAKRKLSRCLVHLESYWTSRQPVYSLARQFDWIVGETVLANELNWRLYLGLLCSCLTATGA